MSRRDGDAAGAEDAEEDSLTMRINLSCHHGGIKTLAPRGPGGFAPLCFDPSSEGRTHSREASMLVTSLPARIVERVAGRLRFPTLFLLTATLFVVNLLVPDPLPFVDEILLGLVTLMLGIWKERGRDAEHH